MTSRRNVSKVAALEPLAPAPGEPLADIFAEIGGDPAARLRAAPLPSLE